MESMKKIAIQGQAGSFHHVAACSVYGEDMAIVACDTFKSVFTTLHQGQADAAIVAIENSLYGSINEVYDLLLEYPFAIVGEVEEKIHQCLITLPGVHISDITAVHSHPVALSQCTNFLDQKLPQATRYERYDTAESVTYIKRLQDPKHAAIASSASARMHNLPIAKSNIQNHQSNSTRFFVIDTKKNNYSGSNKASLVIETTHTPGALYEALGVFKSYNANLTKLQSRPIQSTVWRYMFYVDIETTPQNMPKIIDSLQAKGCKTILLGMYTKNLTTVNA